MDSNSLEVLRTSFDLPLLTREQEIVLFRQFQAGGPNAQEAREKIFLHNIRLVNNNAKKMFPYIELGDKIQWGIIGLNNAIQGFDLQKGHKFSTYASYWIRQVIGREAGHYSSCGFSLPNHFSGDLSRLIRLVNREGIEPSIEVIINHPKMARTIKGKLVKVSKVQAERLLELYTKHLLPASLDQELAQSNGNMGGKLGDFIPDQDAESAFDLKIDRQIIDLLLPCLSDIQRQVITLRFLGECMTVAKVSKQVGLSTQRIRQILAASLERMRQRADELNIKFP